MWLDGGTGTRSSTRTRVRARRSGSGCRVWPGGHDGGYWQRHYSRLPALLRARARALLRCFTAADGPARHRIPPRRRVRVRGLLDAAEVERLAAAVDAHMADPGPLAIEGGGDATSGRFFEDFRNWDRIDGYEEVIRGSRIGEVAAAADGQRERSACTTTTCWSRSPGRRSARPGTRTSPTTTSTGPTPSRSGSRSTRCRARARSSSSPARTRRGPGTCRARSSTTGRSSSRTARSGKYPTSRPTAARSTILGWPLEPGDAVAFNMLTLHAAAGSRNRRRAFSVRLVGEDVRLRRAPARDEPAVPGARRRAGERRRARPPAVPAALAARLSGVPRRRDVRPGRGARPRLADHAAGGRQRRRQVHARRGRRGGDRVQARGRRARALGRAAGGTAAGASPARASSSSRSPASPPATTTTSTACGCCAASSTRRSDSCGPRSATRRRPRSRGPRGRRAARG